MISVKPPYIVLVVAAVSVVIFSSVASSPSGAYAQASKSNEENLLQAWKAAIVNAVHDKVKDIDLKNSKGGFSFCHVSFKVNKDGSISDVFTDDRDNGYFAEQVRERVLSLTGSTQLEFPKYLQRDFEKFDFSLTSDDVLPITGQTRIPMSPDQHSPVAANWEIWQRKIAEELYSRIYKQLEPVLRDDSELHCVVTYKVKRLAQIELLKIEGSGNLVFRGIVTRAVESLQNDPIIIFPQNSGNSKSITKTSEFSFRLKL